MTSLVAWGLLVRVVAWLTMPLSDAPDTPGYLEVLRDLRHLDFRGFDGVRTPGVPAFWLLLGSNRLAIGIATSLLMIAASVVLYRAVLGATGRVMVGWLVGAAFVSWPFVVHLERMLLSDAFSTVLVVAVMVLAARCVDLIDEGRALTGQPLLGMALAWLLLSRPASIAPVAAVLLLLMARVWRSQRDRPKMLAVVVACTAGPSLLFMGFWIGGVMRPQVGRTTPSTLTGYALSDVTCRSIDHADPRDSDLRRIFAPEVHRRLARRGSIVRSCAGTSKAVDFSGLDGHAHPTQAQVSARLQTMSLRLVRRDPVGVAAAVANQGVVQWLGFDRRYPADMRTGLGWLANPFTGMAVVSQFLLNMAFLASTAWWLLVRWRRRRAGAPPHAIPPLASVAFAMVWASALFNPFFTAWLTARLLVPMVPAQLVVVALTWQARCADRAAAATPDATPTRP